MWRTLFRWRKEKCFLGLVVLLAGLVAVLYWELKRPRYQAKRVEQDFRKIPLLSYGLMPQEEKEPAIVRRMIATAKVDKKLDTMSSMTSLSGTEKFVNVEALYYHLRRTVRDLRQFLVLNFRNAILKAEEAQLVKSFAMSSAATRSFFRVILKELDDLHDQSGHRKRAENAMNELKRKVQQEIFENQNPKDCRSALTCDLHNPYGFSSGIHDVLWCMIKAYHLRMPVQMASRRWHYAPGGWGKVFMPLSSTCKSAALHSNQTLPGPNLTLGRGWILKIPADILSVLVRYHSDPYAWWFGQFMEYIMRLQDNVVQYIQSSKSRLGLTKHYVGLHIRRTDKFSEAAIHEVEEYMAHVEEFFRTKEELYGSSTRRVVFVATDDPGVIHELRDKFPQYDIKADERVSSVANKKSTRYSLTALHGILHDVFLLADSEFLVCTFSSGLCRVVYELMQNKHVDASARTVSLDVEYYYAYVRFPPKRAIYKNSAIFPNEMWLKKGDNLHKISDVSVIVESIRKKYWDGYSVGSLKDTIVTGLFPTYKTVPQFHVYKSSSWSNRLRRGCVFNCSKNEL